MPKGNPAQLNEMGKKIVEEILDHPAAGITVEERARFGLIVDIRLPDGKGVRFNSASKFIGFLETWR